MPIECQSEDAKIIRQLIPLSRISEANFIELCSEISVEQARSGNFLFKQGSEDNDLIYLIDGQISLQTDEFKVETIKSGTESARFALAHQIPRKIDALAKSNIRFLRLNVNILKSMQQTSTEEEESHFMVIDEPEENEDDWMTALLKSPIFRALPPANLQRIIMGLETISFNKGETIINQGEPGEYYYFIKNGECQVARKPSLNAKAIKLGELKSQDTFGEEALLSDEPRSVSIIASTDVSLLRLNKENFIDLIKTPSLKFVNYQQALEKVAKGALLMDVRSQDAYKTHHLENSTNVPLFSLRMHIKSLNKKQQVIVVCENGKTSKAAAFFLLKNKINALILEGGMEKIPDHRSDQATYTIDDGIDTSLYSNNSDNISQKDTETNQQPSPLNDSDQNIIEQLNQKISELEENNRLLASEKEEISKNYKILNKQTQKLKAVLDSLKKEK